MDNHQESNEKINLLNDTITVELREHIINENLEIKKALKVTSEALKIQQLEIQKIFKPLQKALKIQQLEIQKIFDPNINFFQNLAKIINNNLPDYLSNISKHGWFINLDDSIDNIQKLQKLINDGNITQMDKILIRYYSENLDYFFNKIIDKFPERKYIFDEILYAYKHKKYYLTIITTITQIDGICFDTTSKKYFIRNRKTHLPEVASEFSNFDGILKSFLNPILNDNPINSSEKKITNFPKSMNRHSATHGVDKNYGTKINSLKILSLLFSISDMLLRIK